MRFDAYHTKLKAWKTWRDAMPNALQARKAREVDRRAVLSMYCAHIFHAEFLSLPTVKVFEKWHKAYKTKIELKAVASVPAFPLSYI